MCCRTTRATTFQELSMQQAHTQPATQPLQPKAPVAPASQTAPLPLDPNLLRLVRPQPGIVAESHVVEGRSVHKGDVLFVLTVDSASLSGDTQAAVQSSLSARRRSLQEAVRHDAQLRQEQLAGLDRQIADM